MTQKKQKIKKEKGVGITHWRVLYGSCIVAAGSRHTPRPANILEICLVGSTVFTGASLAEYQA
jgi:hypothetical protein